MNILLTGFEPWGEHRENPSGVVAAALDGHVLPVDFAQAARGLKRLIAGTRPDAVLMLGLAAGRTEISLEAVALNVDPRDAGEAGRRWRRPVRRRGPIAIEARLPLDRILRRLRAARMPAAISHHAGTFVCNHLFYEGLATFDGPCGFVHVPPFTVLSRRRQISAIRTILRTMGASSPGARR